MSGTWSTRTRPTPPTRCTATIPGSGTGSSPSTTVIDGKLYNSTAAGIALYVIDTASGNLIEYGPENLFHGETLGVDSRSSYRFGPKVAGNVPVFFHELLVAVPGG